MTMIDRVRPLVNLATVETTISIVVYVPDHPATPLLGRAPAIPHRGIREATSPPPDVDLLLGWFIVVIIVIRAIPSPSPSPSSGGRG